MERIEICYIVIAALVVLNFIMIYISVKCSYKVDDDFEFYDEDGDHIYYDRKLIRHKTTKIQNSNESDNSREAERSS